MLARMSGFGDADPEDAYDEGDPPEAKLAVLARMLLSVSDEASYPHDHAGRRCACASRWPSWGGCAASTTRASRPS